MLLKDLELVSLLVCSACVYRLKFKKSGKPFGLELNIEKAVGMDIFTVLN